ncbi:serine protein kinase RIO [Actinopolymorpha singaporensis]|uniref:non-specific serine/threonine protein kinase n=1 Tax=Actinopolymorpha singaporensis TaxID=117157 RepID=A0A1H1L4T5_9ACTN|nr:RIO1 family regulatory kinase/ATPase [Actinopolymorpha singaporensis]SDR69292.1 RIO kinase 1 [Actinopolymorpha singaporensis]
MRKRNLKYDRNIDVSAYDLADGLGPGYDDAPASARMRRRRSDAEPGPRSRGRMTEEARARLAAEREAVEADDGPPTGYRWTTWDDPGGHGPEPYPSWLVTDLGAVDTEFGVLKTGKEADVFLIQRGVPDLDGTNGTNGTDSTDSGAGAGGPSRCLLASKRYRSADHRLFHRDAGYLEGRRSRRTRDQRAVENRTNFGRNLIAQRWAVAEFDALSQLWTAGLPVPYPVQHLGTELLMEFIGSADGQAAPRLAQLRPEPDQLADLWRQLHDALVLLGRNGYAHGDLSAYNLLVNDGELILIDLPQLVDVVTNPQGQEFLRRDVKRICEWFVARGMDHDLADADRLAEEVLEEAGAS